MGREERGWGWYALDKRKYENMVLPVCLLRACMRARQQFDNNLKCENMILSVRACLPACASLVPAFFRACLLNVCPDTG